METQKARDVVVGLLVAGDHVLRDALQTDLGVGGERKTPQLAVVFAKIPGRRDGGDALQGGDGVGPRNRWVRSVEIGRLNFDVADALLPSDPILAREECGIRIRERAAGRDYG